MPRTGKNHLVYQVAEAIRPAHHVAVSLIGTNCLMEKNGTFVVDPSVLSNLWENLCLSWDP